MDVSYFVQDQKQKSWKWWFSGLAIRDESTADLADFVAFFLLKQVNNLGIPALCIGSGETSVIENVKICTNRDAGENPTWVDTKLLRINGYSPSNQSNRFQVTSTCSRRVFALQSDVITVFRNTLIDCDINDSKLVYRPALTCGIIEDTNEEIWVVTGQVT